MKQNQDNTNLTITQYQRETSMMMNLQLREPLVQLHEGMLDVVDVWSTIQGEGPFAGMPAVFVRLAGCNMQCYGCDTNYTDGRQNLSFSEVAERIDAARRRGSMINATSKHYKRMLPEKEGAEIVTSLVVLTGGEPFRQLNVGKFMRFLNNDGLSVQVETNGTLAWPHMDKLDEFAQVCQMNTVICSPKAAQINPKLREWIGAYKYVVRAGEVAADGLPKTVLGSPIVPARPPKDFDKSRIYLQPMDEQNEMQNQENLEAALESCLKHGYRMGIQMHKLLNVA